MSYTLSYSPLLGPLLADKNVAQLFSAEEDISTILGFEAELANAQEKCGIVPKGVSKAILNAAEILKFDQSEIDGAIARDGVVVPYLVSLLKKAVPSNMAEYVHKSTTSQDAIDTSFMMRAGLALDSVAENLEQIGQQLEVLRKSHGKRALMGRTRMQLALPITVGDRLNSWENNVATTTADISNLDFLLQLSGPVGTYADAKVKELMGKQMGLIAPLRSWQNDRGPMLAIGNACAGLSGALGKIGMDISLMVQNEFAEIKLRGGGGSSAMPHKHNPVKAEVLVSLARYNASLISGLHNAAVHEQERSGAAWTLEWLVMPQMICAAAGSAKLCRELLDSVESIGA